MLAKIQNQSSRSSSFREGFAKKISASLLISLSFLNFLTTVSRNSATRISARPLVNWVGRKARAGSLICLKSLPGEGEALGTVASSPVISQGKGISLLIWEVAVRLKMESDCFLKLTQAEFFPASGIRWARVAWPAILSNAKKKKRNSDTSSVWETFRKTLCNYSNLLRYFFCNMQT